MSEASSGVYVSATMTAKARDKVWDVISGWHASLRRGSIIMINRNKSEPSGLQIRVVGEPARALVDLNGMYIMKMR
jgi:CRISPR-associated protein Cas2